MTKVLVESELLADLIGSDHDKRINAERSLYATLANAQPSHDVASVPTFPCESCGAFHSYSEVAEADGYCPQCEADYDEPKMFAGLLARYAALAAAPKAEQPPVQEPVTWRCRVASSDHWALFPTKRCRFCEPLYAAPQPVSDAYRIAVDTGLVCAHLGVTNPEDNYETVRKKLNDLICWSIQVDRDLGPADALVKALEQITRMTYDEWTNGAVASRIADEALAAYRAAMGSKGDGN